LRKFSRHYEAQLERSGHQAANNMIDLLKNARRTNLFRQYR
jgi:hypothetical protein